MQENLAFVEQEGGVDSSARLESESEREGVRYHTAEKGLVLLPALPVGLRSSDQRLARTRRELGIVVEGSRSLLTNCTHHVGRACHELERIKGKTERRYIITLRPRVLWLLSRHITPARL